MPDKKIIDIQTGQDELGDAYWELVLEHIKISEKMLAEVKTAVYGQNWAKVRSLAHTIKGASSNLFLENLQVSAYELERTVKEDRFQDSAKILNSIYTEMNKLKIELRHLGKLD